MSDSNKTRRSEAEAVGITVVALKPLTAVAVAVITILGTGTAVYTQYVTSQIVLVTDKRTDDKIDAHRRAGPHPGAVTKEELSLILHRLDTIEAQQLRIEDKVDRLGR